MHTSLDLAELRSVMLSAPESTTSRILAIILSITLLVIVLRLVRHRRLREEYTPVWVAATVGIAAISIVPGALRLVTYLLGAWTPSSTVFFLGLVFLTAICLNYAVRLSRSSTQIKNLAQEIALLRSQVQEQNDKRVSADDSPR
jgi:hypothetical protein